MVGPQSSNIQAPDVETGPPLNDPFGHHLAYSSGRSNSMGAEASRYEEVFHLCSLSHDEVPVRREGLRAIEQGDDFSLADGGYPFHRQGRKRLKMLVIGFEEFLGEIPGNPVEGPGNRIMFVSSHTWSTQLFTKIDQEIRITHGGHSARNSFDRFGDDILVLHGNVGDGDSTHFPYVWKQ